MEPVGTISLLGNLVRWLLRRAYLDDLLSDVKLKFISFSEYKTT